MRFQGKLSNWQDDKGFGFVEPNGGGQRCFVHIKSFKQRSRRPIDGDIITYEQIKENNGKFKAVNITLPSDRKRQTKTKSSHKSVSFAGVVAAIFWLSLGALMFLNWLPIEIAYLYVGASVITFFMYVFDKSAAQKGRWRTPESQLHFWSVIGGWPGAHFAQSRLRHKSSKKEFRQVYWATIVINLCAFSWLLTDQGQALLGTLLIH
ncbi:cold shock and DUF1294 domain-containing protein [Pseudoalteromonas sp. YIC-656]|uniref:cold shock and DUF1294 domain-containing protein n=1 Tax=Pseudoalteromonas pernae TaxID=3118054 RepID=UPI003241C1D9